MRALDPRRGEQRVEQVVTAQRDEAVGLHATTAPQHLLDRRAQVVIAHLAEHPAEPRERLDVALQERLLSLHRRSHAERRPRKARAHEEHVHRRRRTGQADLSLAPVNLRRLTRRVNLRHEHLPASPAQLATPLAHVIAHRRLGHTGAVLVNQTPPNPLRRVALLARRVAVGDQPPIDQLAIPAQLGRRHPHRHLPRRRHRRPKRLTHRAPMDPMTLSQRPDPQPLPLPVTPDLLEQLHS